MFNFNSKILTIFFFINNYFFVNLSFIDASFKKLIMKKFYIHRLPQNIFLSIMILMIIFNGLGEVTKMHQFLN